MNATFLPSMTGLLLGLLLHWTGFSRGDALRRALGLRRSYALRSGLTAVGFSAALTALLMWLAVIDVDTVDVLPLSAGALIGGALLGICAGLAGFTPLTAFAGLGAGNAAEALCVLAGCFLGANLPGVDGLLAPLHTLPPYAPASLFKVTLDEPCLLGGSFLGLGCLGLLLWVIALCIPSPRMVILTEEEIAARAEDVEPGKHHKAQTVLQEAEQSDDDQPSEEETAPKEAEPSGTFIHSKEQSAPEEASEIQEDTAAFISLQEGEEPLIIDTENPPGDPPILPE